jgi:hypothetical protein
MIHIVYIVLTTFVGSLDTIHRKCHMYKNLRAGVLCQFVKTYYGSIAAWRKDTKVDLHEGLVLSCALSFLPLLMNLIKLLCFCCAVSFDQSTDDTAFQPYTDLNGDQPGFSLLSFTIETLAMLWNALLKKPS